MYEIISKSDRATLFRTRLASALQMAGVSRAGLARATGVDRSTVTQLLTSEDARMPGGHLVAGCAQALEVSADWLLGLSDRAERTGSLLATTMADAERAGTGDDRIFDWHREAAGYKIRHVPATLPDMLKTHAVMEWEYGDATGKSAGQAIAAASARYDWMRSTDCDYEIALPLHRLTTFARGSGYFEGLAPAARREQIDWLRQVYDQLYPTLRLVLYDARRIYCAPITVFGPKLAAIYLGRYYVAFRDRDRVQAVTRNFDGLVREARLSARDIPDFLATLRAEIP